MTLALPLVRFAPSMRQCAWPGGCPVNIPTDRELCHFHIRPETPPQARLDHVRDHLRAQDRPYLDWLLLPLTFDEIAEQLGSGWTRRQVESAWYAIRGRMGLSGHPPVERLALLRIVANLDPCFCQTGG